MTPEVAAYAARVPRLLRVLYFWRVTERALRDAAILGSLLIPEREGHDFIERDLRDDSPACRKWLYEEWLRWLQLSPGNGWAAKTVAYLKEPASESNPS